MQLDFDPLLHSATRGNLPHGLDQTVSGDDVLVVKVDRGIAMTGQKRNLVADDRLIGAWLIGGIGELKLAVLIAGERKDGIVEAVHCKQGDTVPHKSPLVEIGPEEETAG